MIDATDLFAGGGGASCGLSRAGIHIAAAANHDAAAIATHTANHPDTEHINCNLMEFDYRRLPPTFMLWGSPSCVWHAPSGGRKSLPLGAELLRGHEGSVDRATAFAIIAAAEVHLYPVIVVENVDEFRRWSLYRWWLAGLAELGYETTELLLDAADFGHAQHRRRRYIVATRGITLNLTLPVQRPVYASEILDLDDIGTPVTRKLYVTPQIEQIADEGVPHLVTYRRNAKARRADCNRLATITAQGNHHALATLVEAV